MDKFAFLRKLIRETVFNMEEKKYKYNFEDLAGNKVKTGQYLYHSAPISLRETIGKSGLIPTAGDSYSCHVDLPKEECIPAIFAINSSRKSDFYDSTWDDDVWQIDNTIAHNEWHTDNHFDGDEKYVVTFKAIPPNALKLVYTGTGKDKF